MSCTESELKFEGQWVIRLGPCFVVLLEAKPEVLTLCPGAVKKLEDMLNQPF